VQGGSKLKWFVVGVDDTQVGTELLTVQSNTAGLVSDTHTDDQMCKHVGYSIQKQGNPYKQSLKELQHSKF
jgi:hypothetical protein